MSRNRGIDDASRDPERAQSIGREATRISESPASGAPPVRGRREDAAIEQDVKEALRAHADLDGEDVAVIVQEGFVTLSGRVPDRRARRLVLACCERIPGVLDVSNRLRVKSRPAEAP